MTRLFFFNYPNGFYSGFRNQIFAFTAFIIWTRINDWGQVIYYSGFKFKDLYGTNMKIPFDWLFDIEHWNSHYPALPRLVACNSRMHKELNCKTHKFLVDKEYASSPFSFDLPQHRLFMQYMKYSDGGGPLKAKSESEIRHPAEIIMKKGALRPNEELKELIDEMLNKLNNGNDASFFTLHARVEPDMQKHVMCLGKKETNLTKIFEHLQETFPEPPAQNLFLPINRQMLESEGYPKKKKSNDTNWLAVENLSALNRAVSFGLWNGTVKAFEFGANSLEGTKFGRFPSTMGAWINFYLATESQLYIGTEISTWSFDVMQTRFYKGNLENYKYLPTGIERWTKEGEPLDASFKC